jgi:hypothetical protein
MFEVAGILRGRVAQKEPGMTARARPPLRPDPRPERQYFVSEDRLIRLAPEGSRITSNLPSTMS